MTNEMKNKVFFNYNNFYTKENLKKKEPLQCNAIQPNQNNQGKNNLFGNSDKKGEYGILFGKKM